MAFKRPEGAKKALVQIQLRITHLKEEKSASFTAQPLSTLGGTVEKCGRKLWNSIVEQF